MTAFTTITNALVEVGAKPFATTVQALRDNPVAMGEKDITVPVGLRLGKYLLGTMAPTSGTTTGLSGLDLSTYVTLEVVIRNVSTNNNSSVLRTGTAGSTAVTGSITNANNRWYGTLYIDLATGFVTGSTSVQDGTSQLVVTALPGGGAGGLVTNASTAVDFNLNLGNFDAPPTGSPEIAIYGVR
jgi:hypothetical protein